jgi:hypothetical protein
MGSTKRLILVVSFGFTFGCGDDNGSSAGAGGGVNAGGSGTGGSNTGGASDGGIGDPGTSDGGVGAAAGNGGAPNPDAASEGYTDPTGRSGTRLRRRYVDAGAGAYRTLDFWDSELGVACAFATAPDSELRCLPRGLGWVYFTDESCTQPIMITDTDFAGYCDHAFGRTSGRAAIYRITSTQRSLQGNTVYSAQASGGCIGYYVDADASAWVAEEMPSARFVQGTTSDEPRSAGMVARHVNGADGSSLLLSTLDTARSSTCDFAAEPGWCLPSAREAVGLFSDASCTGSVAAAYGTTAPQLLYQTLRTADFCVASTDYYEVGAELAPDAALYRRDAQGVCQARARDASYSYYARGAPVSLSTFPTTQLRQEGTGSVRAHRYVDAEDRPLGQAHAFWDGDRNWECQPARLPDGSYRCIPTDKGAYDDGYFSDAACKTSPLGVFYCQPNAAPYITRLATDWSCERDIYAYEHVYERGPAVEGQVYFGNDYNACEARTPTSPNRYHNIGASVPASEFPELELKTE